MTDNLSFMDEVEGKIEPTKEELEKLKVELLKDKEKLEPVKELFESEVWKNVQPFIKDYIYSNTVKIPSDSTNTYYYDLAWGHKMFLGTVEAHAKRYDEIIKTLSRESEE